MPVFDLIAFGKMTARVLIIIGIISMITGFSYLFAITSFRLLEIVTALTNTVDGLFSGGGTSQGSCLMHYLSVLGIDLSINFFFVSLFGLLSLYGGILIHMTIMKFGLFLKGLLLAGVK